MHYFSKKERIILDILQEIGLPINTVGFYYIKDAIEISLTLPIAAVRISKDIYPDLAQKYHTKVNRIEGAMRHAINVSWSNNRESLQKFFKYDDISEKRPCNTLFIATLTTEVKRLYSIK